MARNSQIEWTHHTFNPWWGCAKVSPACENCYAELWAKRMGQKLWGKEAPRRLFGDAHWREPLAWNEEAKAFRVRHRVFCASMADVFEDREDLLKDRIRLWKLIESTPCLDWLLLTKRPENVRSMAPWNSDEWPVNVWLGTTVENQKFAEQRLPHLLQHKAAVRFLSCEPLLGPLNLTQWFHRQNHNPINWIIAGGESGPGARPMHPDWPKSLLAQCQKASVPFHFKQWGHWVPAEIAAETKKTKTIVLPSERPVKMVRLPKKEAGRLLAGQIWDGLPAVLLKANG
ncbi:MAG TPA: phage Gp37/Gp68 family protein [Verrucomicrobiae bacterium]